MPENKKHHYVPQFYFRNFSFDTGRVQKGYEAIALYNLERKLHITSAKIKDQCQEDYLYSRDNKFEKELSKLEGLAMPVIAEIIKTDSRPIIGSEEHFHLLKFLVCQRSRTVSAGNDISEMANRSLKAFKKEYVYKVGPLEMNLNKLKSANDYPSLFSLQNFSMIIPSISDLCIKILINKTDIEFITSDSPVVLFNQWCQESTTTGNLGWASSGIQIFLPISPKHVVVLFDNLVYVAGKGEKNIEVTNVDDIKLVNSLQVVSANENLYFSGDERTKRDIDSLPFQWHRSQEEKFDGIRVVAEDGRSELLHFEFRPSDARLNLSFMKIQKSKNKIPLKERLDTYRKSAMNAAEKAIGIHPDKFLMKPDQLEKFSLLEKI